MHKSVKKTKAIKRYMEALALYTGKLKVHWKDNTRCIYVVEAKIVTRRVKHINIPVFFNNKSLTMVFLLQNVLTWSGNQVEG